MRKLWLLLILAIGGACGHAQAPPQANVLTYCTASNGTVAICPSGTSDTITNLYPQGAVVTYCISTNGALVPCPPGGGSSSGISGSGTPSFLPLFSGSTAVGNSSVTDDGTTVGTTENLQGVNVLEPQSLGVPAHMGLLQSSLTPPLSNSPVGYASWTHAIHFGTSITFGDDSGTGGLGALCTGISTDKCDTSLNDVALGIPLANKLNYGVPGYFQADITNTVFNHYSPTLASGLTTYVTMESGDNENQLERNSPGAYSAVYEMAVGAAVTWLDTPLENKSVGSAWILTSGFAADTTYASANGVSSTTNASTISSGTFTINNSYTPVIIWYDQLQTNGGTATYTVYDVTASTADRTGTITFTPAVGFGGSAGTTHSPGFIIVAPFVTSALFGHTFQVNFTVTSATSASNIVRLLAVGTGPNYVYQNFSNWTPNVWVADAHMLANDLFSQSTASFQGFMKAELWSLKQQGFPFTFDEMQNALNGQVADYGLQTGATCTNFGATSPCVDYPHPNAAGHAKRSAIWLGPGTYVLSPQNPNITLNAIPLTAGSAIIDPFNSPYGLAAPNSTQTLTCLQDVVSSSSTITLTLPTAVCNPNSNGAGKSMLIRNGAPNNILSVTSVNSTTVTIGGLGWIWVTQQNSGAWISIAQSPPYSLLGDMEFGTSTAGAATRLAGPTAGAGTYFLSNIATTTAAVAPTWTNAATYLASPPAIGGTASAAGSFTTLSGSTSTASPIFQSTGTKFTIIAGSCAAATSLVGGASSGKFNLGTVTGLCTATITIGGATGFTANNGYSCHANDETSSAGNTGLFFNSNTATTATLTVPATAVTGDFIDFACTAY